MYFVFENNNWWQVKGTDLYNMAGSHHRMEKGLIIQASDWTDLDWSCLLSRKSSVGWIAPDGTWFGCEPRNHALLAELFLKSDEKTLEQKGWVKVYRDWTTRKLDWYVKDFIVTQDQAKTLRKKGFADYYLEGD